jgi:hypothetical protein
MKKTLLLFLGCLALGIGFAQNNEACTQRLKDAASAEKGGDYLAALRIYTAARSYCTGNTVDEKIEAMLKKIDGLLVEAEQEKEITAREKLRSDSLAQAILDKIYFYNNRFGLAYDKNKRGYGFIDRNLNTKIEFKYNEALPFDDIGFAKVKRYDEEGNPIDYLIDTLGRKYRVAYEVEQLKAGIVALDLRNRQLNRLPNTVFQHTDLQVLLLSDNQLTSLPPEIGQLNNLQELYLRDNPIPSDQRASIRRWLPKCEIIFEE